MRFSFSSNSTLSNRRQNRSTKVTSPRFLSQKHLNYFPIIICTLICLDSMLMRLSVTKFTLILHVMLSITKRILPIVLKMIDATLIYIRILKSKRNAEMQIKNLDLIKMVDFINSINPLEYSA
jgi:hypothetical protein